MAHYQQRRFTEITKEEFPAFFENKKILEVGSWDTNGSVRGLFNNCDYVGADIAAGPGVDIVCPGELLSFPNESFDLTTSCECFEHNPNWVGTFNNMHRMLKPGGLMLMTCATIGRGEHGTARKSPNASLTVKSGDKDYYRNLSKNDFLKSFDLYSMFDDFTMHYNIYSCDIYFLGFKKSTSEKQLISQKFCKRASEITAVTEPSTKKKIEKTINFWSTFAYATMLGEEKYHDIKFALSSRVKK